MTDDWSTTEFLLRGRFCPVPAIRDRLGALRAQMDADAILLLVADQRAVLRTLCTFVDRTDDPNLTPGLQSAIGISPGLQDLVRGPSRPRHHSSYRFPRSTERIISHLEDDLRRVGDPARSWFEPAPGWVPLLPSERLFDARIATAVLVYRPDSDWVETIDGRLRVVEAEQASVEIAEMINCTLQADVRRDAVTASYVDRAVQWEHITLDAAGFSLAAQKLVQLAVTVADCHVGALYVNEGDALELAAVVQSDGALPTTVPQRIDDATTTGLTSLTRNRAVQLSSWYPSRTTTPTFHGLDGAEGWSELATPVLGPSANMSLPPTGVLIVARAGSGAEAASAFSAYDYSVLRNVAMRLALVRAATDVEEVARSYTNLSRRVPGADQDDGAGAEREALPTDLKLALPRIRAALVQIVRATRSRSGTFRAALPDPADAEVGLTLVRVAAHPGSVLDDAAPRQPRSEGGKIWEAALNGEVTSVPRTSEDRNYVPLRPGSKSALTLPVLVEGRVIGVINLESHEENAYVTQIDMVSLFATHVAHAINDVRLVLSRGLQALAIEVVTQRHDFAWDAKQVVEFARKLPQPQQGELEAIADTIDERARQLRTVSDEAPPTTGTFPELLRSVLGNDNPVIDDVVVDPAVVVWPAYGGERGAGIAECLRHVITNVKGHTSTEPGSHPTAFVGKIVWGGREHDVLHITHRVDSSKSLSRQKALDVYRVPLSAHVPGADGDPRIRPRFGAYLAGLQARRLDGDVWLTVVDERPLTGESTVRVSVAIPRA